MLYINSNKINEIKLVKNNFYVLMDFDCTITVGGSISCWKVLYHSSVLGKDFRKNYNIIHDKPIPDGSSELKIKYYEEK